MSSGSNLRGQGRIDYSKWDRMDWSDDDDDDETDTGRRTPHVTHLDQPSRVTAQHDGTLWIEPEKLHPTATATVAITTTTNKTSTNTTVPTTTTTIAKTITEWTQQGGTTRLPKTTTTTTTTTKDIGEEGLQLYWSQDRYNVILRLQLPTTLLAKHVTVHLSGTVLSYANRYTASGDPRATLHVIANSLSLLTSNLPYPIHFAEHDDNNVDWTMEYLGKSRFLTIVLHKAAPMQGLVLWWRKPLQEMHDIDIIHQGTNQAAKSQQFQETWKKAHQQFRDNRKHQELLTPCTPRNDNISQHENDTINLWDREELPLLSITINDDDNETNNGKLLQLKQYGSDDDQWGIHSCLWNGGIGMLSYLKQHPINSTALIIDLGAGTGIVGLGMGLLGYQHIVLTDLKDALSLMQENVTLNETVIKGVTVEEITWGDPSIVKTLEQKIQNATSVYMLGADIIYRQNLFHPLLNSMKLLWKIQPFTKCLMATQSTRQHLDEFYTTAKQTYGMTIDFLANVTVPEGCTSTLETSVELSTKPRIGKDIIHILEMGYIPLEVTSIREVG